MFNVWLPSHGTIDTVIKWTHPGSTSVFWVVTKSSGRDSQTGTISPPLSVTRHDSAKKPPLLTKCCGVKKSPTFAEVKWMSEGGAASCKCFRVKGVLDVDLLRRRIHGAGASESSCLKIGVVL